MRTNVNKVPRVTKKELRSYLENSPYKVHKCGDPSQCIIADFYKDTALRPNEVVEVFTGSTRIKRQTPTGYVTVAERRNAKWVARFISKFDRIRSKSGSVQSRTVLKKLGSLLPV
jgi:hypothetical protein